MYDEAQGPTSQLRYVLEQIDDRRTDLERRLADLQESMRELDAFERRCREELGRRVT